MRSGGRPPIAPVQLKDGYYIEVCDKGTKRGIKIWCATEKEMDHAARSYAGYKTVILLGEHREGAFLTAPIVHK